MGIGDWGLGIGDWAQSPIPNPQSVSEITFKNRFSSSLNFKKIFYLKDNNFVFKILFYYTFIL
jgi:hypothetical protein